MNLKEVRKVLTKMGVDVVRRSRYNLTTSEIKKGPLYDTLKALPVITTETGLRLTWIMETYGMFIDAGVWGSNPSAADSYERKYDPQQKKVVTDYGNKKYEGRQKGRMTNSVFTSGEGKIKDKFQYKGLKPPMESLKAYIKKNNLRFRNPKGTSAGGQYRSGGQEAMAYWMQNRIWAQGITPTLFFTNAFRNAFSRLDKEFAQAFDLEFKAMFKDTPIQQA